jgi:hypothetical protein
MTLFGTNPEPGREELRRFSTVWLPLFLVAAGFWLRSRTGAAWPVPALGLGAALSILAGLRAPDRMKPLYVGLGRVTAPAGRILSAILLAAIFFLVVLPVGLLRRAAGADPLSRRFDRAAGSYWVPRREPRGPERWFRQF